MRCIQYVSQSQIKSARYFWLAGVLVFFAVIRRELNHLPDLFISSDFLLLNHTYDWWEDSVLTVVYLLIVGLLLYARQYLWMVIKKVPLALYLIVGVLAAVQYMGENAIVFPHSLGVMVEELTELIIYSIALLYLWRLNVNDYSHQPQLTFDSEHQVVS